MVIKMIKVAICDDEEYFIKKIKKYLEKILLLQGVREYEIDTYLSGKELCSQKEKLSSYTIIFLDVNMKELNGLQTARVVREYSGSTFLVFITAYIDYAPQGYKVEALRYILKDMIEEMLPECMSTVLKKLIVSTQRVKYHFIEGEKEILADDICYVESNGHKLFFKMKEPKKNGKTLYEKLDQIERKMTPYGFLRTHKSYLVNINYIKEINNYKIILKNGEQLSVPRGRYQFVKERFYEYRGEL